MVKLTTYNILIGMVVATGTFGYGFGFGVFISAIGQPGFYIDMKLDPTSAYTAHILGAVQALFAFGAACGAITQGWLADWLGRKKSLAIAAVISLVGAVWTAGSPYVAMLVTVRILHGFGLGMIICLVNTYLTEVSPAHCRGVMSGMTVMGFGLGYVACAWVSFASYYASSMTVQWRLPLALSCIGPLGLLIGLPFVPESPRYLCWVGKYDLAREVIERLHNDPSDPDNTAARTEYLQIRMQVDHDKEQKSGYLQMLIKPSWRRRVLLVFFLMIASQATGVNGMANYMVVIFSTLKLQGSTPLLVFAIYTIPGTIVAFIACFIMDRFGRRTLFLIGFPVLGLNLLIEALLQRSFVGSNNYGGNIACIAFIFTFIILFQFIDAPSFVWCAEIFPTTIRAKGIGIAMFSYFVGFITFSTPGPTAFRDIKWKMYLIFMALSLVCEVIVYFYIPETRNIPIEEMAAVFGEEQEVMVRVTSDGKDVLEKNAGIVVQEEERVSA